ncbi:hypothetical protein VTN00DRAFT_10331 [Thermoascus crustaceus]|uniref:uncharacterized protein n=1 Tax=Thermoascus crustaceus TaxID=5088 RepID=UPI0037422CF0
MSHKFYEGQRLSFDGALCTVRYVGKVQGTTGEWLGVEWDDPTRGKHSGEHKGVRYFKCKSKQSTAGSFVRPSRPADKPRGFLEALHEKYASEFEEQLSKQRQANNDGVPVRLHDLVYFGSKVAEEVGFEKIRKQLAELQELKIVLLDGLRIAGVLASDAEESEKRDEALRDIEKTCPKIIELDLSRNLLRRWVDVWDICRQLKQLRLLKLNGNRFDAVDTDLTFDGITELHLDETLLSWDEIAALSCQFLSLTSLAASTNQISTISTPLSSTIRSLTLENNEIETLSSINHIASLPNLERLSLRGNYISTVSPGKDDTPFQFPRTLRFLDVSHNNINSWSFVNALPTLFPGLQSLRISDNPLYDQPVAPSSVTNLPERPMTVDEAFMLTLARLASVTTVNYSKVSNQDRTNGELYYLSLIGKELSAFPESQEQSILAQHPRYSELCEIYGPPAIKRASDPARGGAAVNPRSLAARLVNFRFYLSPSSQFPEHVRKHDNKVQEHAQEIPRTFDIYRVKAIVSRIFGLQPLSFRLIWETEEWDPIDEANVGEDEWDSSAEEEEGANVEDVKDEEEKRKGGTDTDTVVTREDGNKFVKREVELVDSTRQVGFLFSDDLREARVRVEAL